MLNDFQVKNFKCIDEAKLEIRPLTILCGPNSSGKSSLSQSLLLLKQTAESFEYLNTLMPIGSAVDLGNYPALIRGHNTSRELSYSFKIIMDKKIGRRKKHIPIGSIYRDFVSNRQATKIDFEITYRYLKRQEKIVLRRIKIYDDKGLHLGSRRNRDGTYRFVYRLSSDQRLGWTNPRVRSLTDFFSPIPIRRILSTKAASNYLNTKALNIRRFFIAYLQLAAVELESINYLGPFRQTPSRYYMTGGAMPADIGYRGESSVEYLSYLKMSDNTRLITMARYWLEQLGMSRAFSIETIEGFIKTLTLSNPITGVKVPLIDVGFGVSQVLPVILAVLRHGSGLHIFEQPEIHLHPKSQADMADLFIENISRKRHYIVETHSEHFLNRIRLRITENQIDKNDVIIYYVTHDDSGYHMQKIEIEEEGYYLNVPDEFFDQSYIETKKIMEAVIYKNGQKK